MFAHHNREFFLVQFPQKAREAAERLMHGTPFVPTPPSAVASFLSHFALNNLCIMGHGEVPSHQQALHSCGFVAPLARLRKRQFTQSEIAALAGLSLPTVRLVERGGSDQASLQKMLTVLGLSIEGRDLPSGETLGRRLAALRKLRGFSQRGLAAALGISLSTVKHMENNEASSVAEFAAVLEFLGAGAYLASTDSKAAHYTRWGHSANSPAKGRFRAYKTRVEISAL